MCYKLPQMETPDLSQDTRRTARTHHTVRTPLIDQEAVAVTIHIPAIVRVRTVAGIVQAVRSSYSTTTSPGSYSLGDRSIKSGLYGSDVDELAKLLAQKLYIRSSWVNKKNGYAQYDAILKDAMKRFQKDAGIPYTDAIGKVTIQALKEWDEKKTTIQLGVRDLRYSTYSTNSGADVDELINLLKKAGFAPNPTKLEKEGAHYKMSEDIATAIKLYQAFNSLAATGEANEATIKKLQGK